MKRKILYFLIICMFMFSSCLNHDMYYEQDKSQEVTRNVISVFGTLFPDNQDWISTLNSTVTVHATNKAFVKAQILVSSTNKQDSTINMTILNEAQLVNGICTMTYDVPNVYDNLFIAFITDKNSYTYRIFNLGDTDVYDVDKTRTLSQDYVLPKNSLVIWSYVETYANQRGWFPGEVFYDPASIESIKAEDYETEFKTIFRNVIFSYFKNGCAYNNLPLIKKSNYYNESSYPLTTGDEPIIVSPVYKNDGGYKEIAFADLYYYYFKGDRELTVEEIEALPKYKAIDLSTVYSNSDNNNIKKEKAYALVYWGDTSNPQPRRTLGKFQFPKGYKIGFCYKSNTEYEKPNKQGELYGDGRLNYNINNWGNFKSSKLEATAPRMAWFNINDKIFLCIESGTDADFNDLILEVEGGIEPIIISPPYEYNFYIFLFEDHRLGDYDMNDIVIKGERLNETQVRYTLMSCGTYDDLYIYNIEGTHINNNIEVHDIFGRPRLSYVNTVKGDNCDYVSDVITVNENFSFLDVNLQPYIYDATKDWIVKVSRKGEDPHAIMIPYNIKWPLEKICIKDAYIEFNSWGRNQLIEDNDWYKYPELDKVF